MTARNDTTWETRAVPEPTTQQAERALDSGIDRCTGPCDCEVTPFGPPCTNGWPSILEVATS